MRVRHVLPFPGVGGTEIATRRIADGVRSFGIESDALLLRPNDEQTAYLDAAGIPWTVADPKPEPSFRSGLSFLRDSLAFARACRDADILHCADVPAAYYVAVAGRLARRPVLCHVRNRHPRLSRRDRVFIGATTHFCFVSQATRDQFAMRIPDRRASVVYDGIDIPAEAELANRDAVAQAVRAELGLAPDATIAAMFARINPQKDYPTLIAAAKLLRDSHPRLRFFIVGDHAAVAENGAHFAAVRAGVDAAGVSDRFIFAGFRSDVRRLMLAADVCVLSTHFEGLPLVIIEAMALGRPSVATDVDGIREALQDGTTGLLPPHRDAAGLAAALAALLDDPERAARIGATARAEAQRRFGRQRFAADMHALYQRLAGSCAEPVARLHDPGARRA